MTKKWGCVAGVEGSDSERDMGSAMTSARTIVTTTELRCQHGNIAVTFAVILYRMQRRNGSSRIRDSNT
jgi:hypothetical protein